MRHEERKMRHKERPCLTCSSSRFLCSATCRAIRAIVSPCQAVERNGKLSVQPLSALSALRSLRSLLPALRSLSLSSPLSSLSLSSLRSPCCPLSAIPLSPLSRSPQRTAPGADDRIWSGWATGSAGCRLPTHLLRRVRLGGRRVRLPAVRPGRQRRRHAAAAAAATRRPTLALSSLASGWHHALGRRHDGPLRAVLVRAHGRRGAPDCSRVMALSPPRRVEHGWALLLWLLNGRTVGDPQPPATPGDSLRPAPSVEAVSSPPAPHPSPTRARQGRRPAAPASAGDTPRCVLSLAGRLDAASSGW